MQNFLFKEYFQLKKNLKRYLSSSVQSRLRDCWQSGLLWVVVIKWKNFGLLYGHIIYLFSTSISCVLHVSLQFTFRLGLSLVKWRLASLSKASRSVPFLLLNQFSSISLLQVKGSAWFENRCVNHTVLLTALSSSLGFFP